MSRSIRTWPSIWVRLRWSMTDSKNPETPENAKRRPVHEEFAEKIIGRLKEGTAPWQIP